jgi:hypothetical protein
MFSEISLHLHDGIRIQAAYLNILTLVTTKEIVVNVMAWPPGYFELG